MKKNKTIPLYAMKHLPSEAVGDNSLIYTAIATSIEDTSFNFFLDYSFRNLEEAKNSGWRLVKLEANEIK